MYVISKLSERNAILFNTTQPMRGTLHSVFHSTCNILWSSGNIISIQTCGSPFTPLCLLLENELPNMRSLEIGTRAFYSSSNKKLNIAHFEFDLASALTISCKYHYDAIRHHNLALALPILEKKYEKSIRGQDEIFNSISYRKCRTEMQNLIDSSKSLDERNFLAACQSLIGLGIGLTPSGDDMLIGFFAVAQFSNAFTSILKKTAQQIKDYAMMATTDISREFIMCALDREYSDATTKVLDAIFTQDTLLCEQAVERIIKIGSTSGRDCLYGMICAARMLYE